MVVNITKKKADCRGDQSLPDWICSLLHRREFWYLKLAQEPLAEGVCCGSWGEPTMGCAVELPSSSVCPLAAEGLWLLPPFSGQQLLQIFTTANVLRVLIPKWYVCLSTVLPKPWEHCRRENRQKNWRMDRQEESWEMLSSGHDTDIVLTKA